MATFEHVLLAGHQSTEECLEVASIKTAYLERLLAENGSIQQLAQGDPVVTDWGVQRDDGWGKTKKFADLLESDAALLRKRDP